MDRFEIEGGKSLSGCVSISGSKNATLPLMAAALLSSETTVIENVPDLQDIYTMSMVLRVIGAQVKVEDGRMEIDAQNCNFWEAPYELVRKMRASFYVMGPLLARFGKAKVSLPGGCNLGPRPVDQHLKAFELLGCKIHMEEGYILVETDGMIGNVIDFDIASVGATGNIMMAATAAEGTTILENAACEPEIIDLADMLNAMGARISGTGTSRITIEGPTELHSVNWSVIPDRIETGTFMIAAGITESRISIENCRPDHVEVMVARLRASGAIVEVSGDSITVDATDTILKAVDIIAAPYPAFPTDLQAPWTSLMAIANGSSSITETVYKERYNHVPELIRLGADIRMGLSNATVHGVDRFKAASVMCSDIRAGAGMVLAALAAEGVTEVLRVYHIDRGYDDFEGKLRSLGAEVRRVRE